MRLAPVLLALTILSPLPPALAERADGASDPLRLGFVADAQESGERPGLRAAVRELARLDADVLLYGGDTSYGYGAPPEDWREALGPFRDRTLFVYGNHDGGRGYAPYQPNASANATWWAWSQPGVVVLGLDTNKPLDAGSPQLDWLTGQLDAHRERKVIVMMHIAWWVPDAHHGGKYRVQGNATQLDALMRDGRVDLVLAGHEHYYARLPREGVTYVVNSAVDARTRDVPRDVAGEAEAHSSARAWMRIDVLPCGLAAWTTGEDGRALDAFRVTDDDALQLDGDAARCEPPTSPSPSQVPAAQGPTHGPPTTTPTTAPAAGPAEPDADAAASAAQPPAAAFPPPAPMAWWLAVPFVGLTVSGLGVAYWRLAWTRP